MIEFERPVVRYVDTVIVLSGAGGGDNRPLP